MDETPDFAVQPPAWHALALWAVLLIAVCLLSIFGMNRLGQDFRAQSLMEMKSGTRTGAMSKVREMASAKTIDPEHAGAIRQLAQMGMAREASIWKTTLALGAVSAALADGLIDDNELEAMIQVQGFIADPEEKIGSREFRRFLAQNPAVLDLITGAAAADES